MPGSQPLWRGPGCHGYHIAKQEGVGRRLLSLHKAGSCLVTGEDKDSCESSWEPSQHIPPPPPFPFPLLLTFLSLLFSLSLFSLLVSFFTFPSLSLPPASPPLPPYFSVQSLPLNTWVIDIMRKCFVTRWYWSRRSLGTKWDLLIISSHKKEKTRREVSTVKTRGNSKAGYTTCNLLTLHNSNQLCCLVFLFSRFTSWWNRLFVCFPPYLLISQMDIKCDLAHLLALCHPHDHILEDSC